MKVEKGSKNGHHTTVKSIIDHKGTAKRIYAYDEGDKQNTAPDFLPKLRIFVEDLGFCKLQSVNHEYRKREGNQNPKIKIFWVENEIDELTSQTEKKKKSEMLYLVARITATLGNGECKQGH